MVSIEETFNIDELVDEANRRIHELESRHPDLQEIGGNRNIHYYVTKGLLEPPGRRDKKAQYSKATLDRLVFIRLLQAHTVWDLEQIRQVFAAVSPEQIARIVEGDESLEVVKWTPPPKKRRSAPIEDTSVVDDSDAEEFRRMSNSFAKMADDFAESAAQFAEMARSYSEKDDKKS